MGLLLGIGMAGFAGALMRFWVSQRIARQSNQAFPWGTFVVNLSGAFVLGFLTGLAAELVPASWRTIFGTGFLGAYTTFSTWNLESVRLAERRLDWLAVANVLLSTLGGLLAAAAGLALGRLL